MLSSIKKSYGRKIGASDGEIGQVKDFYFDERNWAVRYLVVDTGSWLPGRKVLISPHSIGRFYDTGKVLRVNLTRKQIEESPSIESHKPVSRQFEEEYYRYYGWPYYWNGAALWGMSGFPILELPPEPLSVEPANEPAAETEPDDAHLCSTQSVGGYNVRDRDGIIGHVCDFLMDTRCWAISELIIKTGNRLSGTESPLPVLKVERISYDDSTLFLNLKKEELEPGSPSSPAPTGAARDADRQITP